MRRREIGIERDDWSERMRVEFEERGGEEEVSLYCEEQSVKDLEFASSLPLLKVGSTSTTHPFLFFFLKSNYIYIYIYLLAENK